MALRKQGVECLEWMKKNKNAHLSITEIVQKTGFKATTVRNSAIRLGALLPKKSTGYAPRVPAQMLGVKKWIEDNPQNEKSVTQIASIMKVSTTTVRLAFVELGLPLPKRKPKSKGSITKTKTVLEELQKANHRCGVLSQSDIRQMISLRATTPVELLALRFDCSITKAQRILNHSRV